MADYTVGQQIGINAVSAGIGGLIGLAGTALQHKYNKQLSEKQFEQNVAMWNMQNEYNSPIAQRNRLEQAGLNPALMYGNGGGSTGNANQMPQYQSFGQDITQNLMTGLQMAQVYANIRKTNAEADKQEKENPYVGATAKAILDNYIANTDLTKEQKNKNIVEQKQLWKSMDKMDIDIAEANKRIDLMNEDIQLRKAQAKTEEEKQKLTEAEKQLVVLQQAIAKVQEENAKKTGTLIDTQADAQKANAVASYASANASNAMANSVSADAVQKEWKNEWRKQNGIDPDANWFQIPMQVAGSCLTSAGNAVKKGWNRLKNIGKGKKAQDAINSRAQDTTD